MKIISISFSSPFENYKEDIKFKDLSDINILIGKNNSGKTTILKNIYHILHSDSRNLKESSSITFKLDLLEFLDLLSLKSNHEGLGNNIKSLFEVLISKLNKVKNSLDYHLLLEFKKIDQTSIRFQIKLLKEVQNQKEDFFHEVNQSLSVFEDNLNQNPGFIFNWLNEIKTQNKIQYIPSLRILEKSVKEFEKSNFMECEEILRQILYGGTLNLDHDNHVDLPFKIPHFTLILNLIKNNQITTKAYKQIFNFEYYELYLKAINDFFPELKISLDFNLPNLQTIGNIEENYINIGDWKNLGHGTQELISLLFLLIIPDNYIYLIDEPDIGLHPGLQNKFLRYLKNVILKDNKFCKQFFFATHSTCFINYQAKCSHYICKKDENSFNIKLLDKNNLISLRKELGLTPSALLQANGIIWVEGYSGIFYIKMIFQCFGIDLDEFNIQVAHYGSNNEITSNHYSIDFFERINPNFCIIIDSEKTSASNGLNDNLMIKKKEFEDNGYFFWIIEAYRNIEGLIPQSVINDYFNVSKNLSDEYLKSPYEKLETYIKRLRNEGIICNKKKYKKTRDAPKICDLILHNTDYKNEIINSKCIKENVEKVYNEIQKWMNGYYTGINNQKVKMINKFPKKQEILGDFKKFKKSGFLDQEKLRNNFNLLKDISRSTLSQQQILNICRNEFHKLSQFKKVFKNDLDLICEFIYISATNLLNYDNQIFNLTLDILRQLDEISGVTQIIKEALYEKFKFMYNEKKIENSIIYYFLHKLNFFKGRMFDILMTYIEDNRYFYLSEMKRFIKLYPELKEKKSEKIEILYNKIDIISKNKADNNMTNAITNIINEMEKL